MGCDDNGGAAARETPFRAASWPGLRWRIRVAARRKRSNKPTRPRVPLIRQTGGAHQVKTKRPWRERKHKKRDDEA